MKRGANDDACKRCPGHTATFCTWCMTEADQKIEHLRAVLRALISCGGTSPIIRATAMNTLEPGSGDKWLASPSEGPER